MQRVKGVEDPNVRIIDTRGILGAGAITPTCIASFRAGESRRIRHDGSTRDPTFWCRFRC